MLYDNTTFVLRGQPFHIGHAFIIDEALQHAKRSTVLVGSSFIPRTYRNPFTFEERKRMIMEEFGHYVDENGVPRLTVLPLEDCTYNDAQWVLNAQQAVAESCAPHFENPKISLIGHSKDETSFYLKLFPQWDSINVINNAGINATDIRAAYFSKNADEFLSDPGIHKLIPPSTYKFLVGFIDSKEYKNVLEEYDYVAEYKKKYADAPYPPIHQTADAVVIQSGHILLVKRKANPGRGLWALPGGFVNANEPIKTAMLRELNEETRIKLPPAVIQSNIKKVNYFDDVYRSSRGRIITHAFLINLPPATTLPRVRGGDDAKVAKWVPLSEIRSDNMFEDHYHIIKNMTAEL